MSCSCIKPWDTNKTLEATFKFIYKNQELPDGNFIGTRVYLAQALKKNQTYDNYNNRDEAFNALEGKILEVKESYFIIETGSPCQNEVQICTVAYRDVTSILSDVIFNNFNKYIAYMDSLPELCDSPGDRYYDILVKLKKELSRMKDSEILYVIYTGLFNLGYSKSQYVIIKNLVVINNLKYVETSGVSPINTVSGFFIVEGKAEIETKEESFVVDNEAIRRCI